MRDYIPCQNRIPKPCALSKRLHEDMPHPVVLKSGVVLAGEEGPNWRLTVRAQGRGFRISPPFYPAYPPFLALVFRSLGVLCSSLTKEAVLFDHSLSPTPSGASHTPSTFDFLYHLGHVTCPFRGEDLHLSLKRLHALHGRVCEFCWAENSFRAYLRDSGEGENKGS